MSFVDMDDIIEMVEGYPGTPFRRNNGHGNRPALPRMTYREAMERFGTDKPDTRYTMEIFDISDLVSGCDFRVFTSALEEGGSVRGICAKNSVNVLSRKELDKLTDYIKGIGGKGIAWIRLTGDGVTPPFQVYDRG